MNYKLIKQIIEYTSGLFCGQRTERYISVYSTRIVPVVYEGSGYKLISEEFV